MHRRLIFLASRARRALAVGALSGSLAGLCSLGQAYALSATVDGVFLGDHSLAAVWPWLRLLLAIVVARGLLLCVQELAANEVAIRVKQDLRERLLAHLLRLGPAFAQGERSAELTTTVADGVEALDAYYSQYVPQIVISILVPVTTLIIVFPVDPISGAILLLTAPLIPFFMYMIGRTAETATARQYSTLGRLASHLLDSVQGLTTLKLFGQSAAQITNIARSAERFRSVTLKVLQVSFLSAFALELVATISTAIIAVEVGLRLLYGHMAFREALFLLVLAPEFYLPLRMLGMRFHAGMAGVAAGRRIFEILDSPAPGRACARTTVSAAGGYGSRNAIEVMDVTYTYPGRDRPALQSIDLAVRRGERIAIVGASGAGKSTLVALLLGFMSPSHGSVRIHGKLIEPGGLQAGGPQIGWVPQRPHLFHDTLAANIRLGKPGSTDAEVWRAAQLAHMDGLAATLRQGFSTSVGEAGARLSSGELQRVALARAFLASAPILILDEPSSSLDPENEALLADSVQRLATDTTVITIAHRLHTVQAADRIVVLDGGRIVECGTHARLVAAGGQYAKMVRAGGLSAPPASEPIAGNVRPPTRPLRLPGQGPAIPGASVTPAFLEVHLTGTRRVLSQFLLFLTGSWKWVGLSVLLGSLTIGSSVALMGTSAWLISTAALHPSISSLGVAIVGVRFFGIVRAVFRYLERLVSHSVTFRLLHNIRVWLYARLEPLAPARLVDSRAGDIIARLMADVDTLENLYVRVLAPPLTAIAVLGAVCTFLVLSGHGELAALLTTMFLLAGVALPFAVRRMCEAPGRRVVDGRAQLQGLLVDGIQGMPDLVALGRAGDLLVRLRSAGAVLARAQRLLSRVGSLQVGFSSALVNLAVWLALVIAIPAVERGEFEGVMVASLALIILSSFEAVGGLPVAGRLWPATQAAGARLLDLVEKPADGEPPAAPAAVATVGDGNHQGGRSAPVIEFRNVTFTYPDCAYPALRKVSFRVDAGSSVAIVGPSGAGKSTVANLLLRFWEPDAGEITLDGAPIGQLDPNDVRARIGCASQHTYLFDTSVYENLRLARRGAARAEVEGAARNAEIHDFITSLPGGYDALIGEHGIRLSAGERQRMGLARLLLKDAPTMLLDEPTANLDAVTEAHILATIVAWMQSRTTVHITHRLIGMERFGQILVMDHGDIVERGSHAQLLGAGGLYSRLWSLQNGEGAKTFGLLAGAA